MIYGQRNVVAAEMAKIIVTAAAQAFGEADMKSIVKALFNPAPVLAALPASEKMALFYATRTYYDDGSFRARIIQSIIDNYKDSV